MALTITATPEPLNDQPRMRLNFSGLAVGESFLSLAVTRDGQLIRQQPIVGGNTAFAYDYEAPFGVSVTYAADAKVATFATTEFDETWASLANWTTGQGTAAVSAGRVVNIGSGGVVITRAVVGGTPPKRLVLADVTKIIGQAVISIGNVEITLHAGIGYGTVTYAGPGYVGFSLGTGALTASWDDSTLSLTTTAGTVMVSRGAWSNASRPLSVLLMTGGAAIGALSTKTTSVSSSTVTAAATLSVADAWLIHPIYPNLSCRIESASDDSDITVQLESRASTAAKSSRNVIEIEGAARSVVVTTGSRAADEWPLVLWARTLDARAAIRALVDDETPLLLRAPASLGWDLSDDYYSVGDVTIERLDEIGMYSFTLPLTPVREPVVSIGLTGPSTVDLLQIGSTLDVLNYYGSTQNMYTGTPA